MIDRKKIREITGYTFERQQQNAASWYGGAKTFFDAACVLHEAKDRITSSHRAFAFNAALSIELMLKAIIVSKTRAAAPELHMLGSLAEKAGLTFSEDQMDTLAILSEQLIWAGRYPTPTKKKEANWDRYHDEILERAVVRSGFGVMAHPTRFPSMENYVVIWKECQVVFDALQAPPDA